MQDLLNRNKIIVEIQIIVSYIPFENIRKPSQ